MSRYRKTLQKFCIVTHEGRKDPSLTLRMTGEGVQEDKERLRRTRKDPGGRLGLPVATIRECRLK